MKICLQYNANRPKFKTHCLVLSFILLFLQGYNVWAQPGASPAIRGNGIYKNSMFWINWDLDNNNRPGDAILNNSVRTVTTTQGITYSITITNLSGAIESYVSGQFSDDDIKTGYNWYKSVSSSGFQSWPGDRYNYNTSPLTDAYDNATDAHNSVIGIRNTNAATTVSFRIKVTATLNGAPTSIAGMTVVGAESINGSNEFEEYTTTATPWQAIERIKNVVNTASTLFRTVADVSNQGRTIRMRNPTQAEGPGTVIWFSKNADYVDVTLKGGGKQAVAIGFLSTFDFGDAPKTYGDAIHLQDVGFSGGIPAIGTGIELASLPLATRNYPALLIGSKVDNDAATWYSADLLGDDTHDEDDEDGLANPYSLAPSVTAGATSFAISDIPVTNNLSADAILMGWIDVNNNGVFDVNEAASTIVASGAKTATLNFFGLSSGLKPFVNYPLRLRLATAFPTANATGQDLRSIGSANEGEVEDHIIKLTGARVSGKVFQDNNRNHVLDGTETLYNAGTMLYAYAVDGSGRVVQKAQVVNGNYTLQDFPLGNIADQNIKVMLSAADITIGAQLSNLKGTAPEGYSLSGEDVSQTEGAAKVGLDSNDFVVDVVNVPSNGLGNINFGLFLQSLAEGTTVFGSFEAKVAKGQLQVNWNTLSEFNTDHFEVQVSKDNINFVTVGEVASSAPEGNSKSEINYSFSSDIGSVFSVLSISLLAFLAISGFKKRGRISFIALLILVLVAGIQCKRGDIDLSKSLFVRVAHIDKNGVETYSRTVQLWVNYP